MAEINVVDASTNEPPAGDSPAVNGNDDDAMQKTDGQQADVASATADKPQVQTAEPQPAAAAAASSELAQSVVAADAQPAADPDTRPAILIIGGLGMI